LQAAVSGRNADPEIVRLLLRMGDAHVIDPETGELAISFFFVSRAVLKAIIDEGPTPAGGPTGWATSSLIAVSMCPGPAAEKKEKLALLVAAGADVNEGSWRPVQVRSVIRIL
jgi:hypothetical protein